MISSYPQAWRPSSDVMSYDLFSYVSNPMSMGSSSPLQANKEITLSHQVLQRLLEVNINMGV
jgi:hypothetical protein